MLGAFADQAQTLLASLQQVARVEKLIVHLPQHGVLSPHHIPNLNAHRLESLDLVLELCGEVFVLLCQVL